MSAAASSTPEDGGVDTREMIVVHTVFRRELGAAPALVRAVAPGDVGRARVVADHVRLMTDLVHLHHTGEDRILWPRLHERVAQELEPVVELMEGQHAAVADSIEELHDVLPRWRAGADATDRDRLAVVLDRLNELLSEHLAAEEERILPLASRCLTQAEWDLLGEEGLAALPKSRFPLVFGMIMSDGDPEVVRGILAKAPRAARLVLPVAAPPTYRRYARRLYGSVPVSAG